MHFEFIDGEFKRWVQATDEYARHLRRHPSLDLSERRRLEELANGLQGRIKEVESQPAQLNLNEFR